MKKSLLITLSILCTTAFAQSWVQKANAPVGRHHPISFAINGKGYAITGTTSNNAPTDDAYEYDPVANTWTTLPDFPGLARSFGMGVVSGGKAYMGFGATTTQYLKDFWSFDPTDGTYTQLASCGCVGRRHPAIIAIGDRIYVGLGDGPLGGVPQDLKDWWMYSIPNNTWTQISDLPGPGRHHPFMFNAGGEVFAGMGHSGQIIYKDWYKLDTANNTWTAMANFPGEARVAGTQFDLNGFGYVLSGDGDNHSFMATGEMWRYNPSNDTWLQFPPHPGQSRWAPGSFVINNEVYFFGGRNRLTNTFPSDLWVFDVEAATISIDEEVLANTYAFPNPANEFISWQHDESITEVKIYNASGQLILEEKADTQRIYTSEFDNGLYLIQFLDNLDVVKTSKVLIQH